MNDRENTSGEERTSINEGKIIKGGKNPAPQSSRPSTPPPAQRPTGDKGGGGGGKK